MKLKRRRRLYAVMAIVVGVGVAVGLALYALNQNINLYFTPSQLAKHTVSSRQVIRIGGVVEKNSVHRKANSLAVTFKVTDFKKDIKVNYKGVLPGLFREGQGIIVQGRLASNGSFTADTVLEKHDATYMPPEIKSKG